MYRVIIADDEPKVSQLIKNLIEWERLNLELVATAQDGMAALELIKEYRPDIVITDIRMPGYDGTNEGSTVGVGNAIKASGKGIIGIGFDKSDAILGLLKDGSLKAAMAQNPFTMGYLGVAQAYAALNDKSTGPAVIDTGVAILRK